MLNQPFTIQTATKHMDNTDNQKRKKNFVCTQLHYFSQVPENVAVTYYLDVNFLKCAYGVNDLAYCNQPNYGLRFSAYVKQIQLNVAFVYMDQDY